MKKQKINIHKGQIIFIILGLIWCFVCYNYLINSGWWHHRVSLSPMEFVGGIGGLALPLVVLFLISAYFDRNEYLEKQARQMRSYLDELIYPTQEGEVYTKELTAALREQIKEFRAVYTGVNQHTDKVRENLQRWIEGLNKLVQTVDSQTVGAVQKIANHIQKLAEITHQSNQQARETTTILAGQADIVHSVAMDAKEELTSVRQNLNQEAKEIQNILTCFEKARQEIGTKMAQCSKMAEVMTENTLRMGKTMDGFDEMKKLTQEAQKVQKQVDQAGNTLEQRAGRLKLILGQMHGDILMVSQGLQAHTQSLEKNLEMKQLQNQDFLKQATSLIEQLQKYSIDLAHLFTPKNEEELWQKYHAGDKAIFMRHLGKELKKAQKQKVRQLFKDNMDFQVAVQQYMKTFEQMTLEASENAADSPLLEVLVGSDVGRLYMVLAQIIKGEEK